MAGSLCSETNQSTVFPGRQRDAPSNVCISIETIWRCHLEIGQCLRSGRPPSLCQKDLSKPNEIAKQKIKNMVPRIPPITKTLRSDSLWEGIASYGPRCGGYGDSKATTAICFAFVCRYVVQKFTWGFVIYDRDPHELLYHAYALYFKTSWNLHVEGLAASCVPHVNFLPLFRSSHKIDIFITCSANLTFVTSFSN